MESQHKLDHQESLEERLKRTNMAEEEKQNLPVVIIDDKQYLLDYSDITGIEWREIKKITGLNSMEAIAQTSMMDFEALASVVFVIAKREDKNVKYEDILAKLTIESITSEEELDQEIPKD